MEYSFTRFSACRVNSLSAFHFRLSTVFAYGLQLAAVLFPIQHIAIRLVPDFAGLFGKQADEDVVRKLQGGHFTPDAVTFVEDLNFILHLPAMAGKKGDRVCYIELQGCFGKHFLKQAVAPVTT